MAEQWRPRPAEFDPTRIKVQEAIDLHAGEPWLLTSGGDYNSFVVYTLVQSGKRGRYLIALQWPTRVNGTDIEQMVQLLIDPEDVRGLMEVLGHTLTWMDVAKRMGN
jgi:hypothetical protein